MLKGIRISLANKCQLLFGLAVVLVMTAALTVVGWRMQTLVEQAPQRRAKDLAEMWLAEQITFGEPVQRVDETDNPVFTTGVLLTLIEEDELESTSAEDPFLEQAIERFDQTPAASEFFDASRDDDGQLTFRYARAVRASDVARMEGTFEAGLDAAGLADPLQQVLLVRLRDQEAAMQQTLNRIYIVAAGLFAGLLAIAVFYYITTRIILSPVRVLRGYAERVSEGDILIRSDINTGDEFEQLSDMFNTMLESIKANQDELQSANKTLDMKLMDMAESNVALFEANKVKGEFLANVSHELRTPLNSIIGFAEVLQETLADRTGPIDDKRKRYASNIIVSSRRLLELINDLLDIAKIEAGKMQLRLATVSVIDTLEGLVTLIRPQADKKKVRLFVEVSPRLPMIETDPGKLQQVVFNFLANAVKFTPAGGTVTLRAESAPPPPEVLDPNRKLDRSASAVSIDPADAAYVRISVADTGPGINQEDQDRIFDKFTQLDPSVTKSHGGTGLGLTIAKELTDMLGGTLNVESAPGRGATFSITLPIVTEIEEEPLPETDETEAEAVDGEPAPAEPASE
ncbi:sensor histidine kinase [Algisphaera agarilytica]|uniref:histidine kinase n=1 Tax=Algisphaera agarilytica TaxID=1385975 RepID=A0A7X0LLJ6_9BACT|nr:HAMP domain-containing sensor histidine kinase [Algisphaera agarilytica]MBB6430979.1 signal transduction histidine kinase [Algisphaera agarilytica]